MAEPAVQHAGAAGAATAPIAAFVLLDGGIKLSPLIEAVGRSTLDLPVGPDLTLLQAWVERFRETGAAGEAEIRLVHGPNIPAPETPSSLGPGVRVVQERDHLRGPAGAARDACDGVDPEAPVLIGEARRCPGCSLRPMVDAFEAGADVVVARQPDGSPAGLYLARRSTLDHASAKGFMDLKEQWLTRLHERGERIRVVGLDDPGVPPVRTLTQYLRIATGQGGRPSPPTLGLVRAETPVRSSLVCAGAEVDPRTRLVDSVVMAGAWVGPGAALVRCLVCDGATVEPDVDLVDAIVTKSGVKTDKMAGGPHVYGDPWA